MTGPWRACEEMMAGLERLLGSAPEVYTDDMDSDERGSDASGARVLVVEDEPHIRDLIALHLSLEGLKPVAVGDGDEGLRWRAPSPSISSSWI